jgi:hypothetical protein
MSIISSSSRLPDRTIVVGAAITALLAGAAGVTARAHRAATASHEGGVSTADRALSPDRTARAQVRERYGHLPLGFEANHGQTDGKVQFLSRGSGYTLFSDLHRSGPRVEPIRRTRESRRRSRCAHGGRSQASHERGGADDGGECQSSGEGGRA